MLRVYQFRHAGLGTPGRIRTCTPCGTAPEVAPAHGTQYRAVVSGAGSGRCHGTHPETGFNWLIPKIRGNKRRARQPPPERRRGSRTQSNCSGSNFLNQRSSAHLRHPNRADSAGLGRAAGRHRPGRRLLQVSSRLPNGSGFLSEKGDCMAVAGALTRERRPL